MGKGRTEEGKKTFIFLPLNPLLLQLLLETLVPKAVDLNFHRREITKLTFLALALPQSELEGLSFMCSYMRESEPCSAFSSI